MDTQLGHPVFLASWYKNYVESLCTPPKMRSVPDATRRNIHKNYSYVLWLNKFVCRLKAVQIHGYANRPTNQCIPRVPPRATIRGFAGFGLLVSCTYWMTLCYMVDRMIVNKFFKNVLRWVIVLSEPTYYRVNNATKSVFLPSWLYFPRKIAPSHFGFETQGSVNATSVPNINVHGYHHKIQASRNNEPRNTAVVAISTIDCL
jgi:hypothetical protein